MKSGFVAILGRPNVGKSTLLNALLSKKVSIVTPKAQTTRDSIMGILNLKEAQIVFVDTPGIFQGGLKLDSSMRKSAFTSSREVDVILYLIDASSKEFSTDKRIFDSIHSEAPRFLVMNKIDLITAEQAVQKKKSLAELFPGVPLIEASFKTNFGLKDVTNAILPLLSEGPAFFPDDVYTDKDPAYQAKEIVREKLLHFLRDEIPHQSAVKITSLTEKKGGLLLEGTIYVEKPSHKAIVIGKGGAMIKKISMAARQEIEANWHKRVLSLELQVEVAPNWRDDLKALSDLGYGAD